MLSPLSIERRLSDCYLRLDRADRQIKAITQTIERFENVTPRRVIAEAHHDPPSYVFRAEIDGSLPRSFGLRIGEPIHHLRSSLDWLACILGSDAGEEGDSKNEFPILLRPTDNKGKPVWPNACATRLVNVSSRAKAVIEGLQPYNGWNAPINKELRYLTLLDIFDKHRKLHVTPAILRHVDYECAFLDPGIDLVVRMTHGWDGPFPEGAKMFQVMAGLLRLPPEPHVKVQPNPPLGVIFDKAGPAGGEDVGELLKTIAAGVRDVFELLSAF